MLRLSPLRRAYLIGFRRGLNRARAEFLSGTARWDDKLRELEDDYATLVSKMQREDAERAVAEAANERALIPDMALH